MSARRVCKCAARMAGECMCGAWDEPSSTAAEAVVELARQRDSLLARLSACEKERDELKRHLDGRIQWQLEAVLSLQTFRALFDAAVAMREGHEGCVTEPACGSCFRCDFDKAVDQAKIEVAAGVDEFIAESAGFWGRFAAKMQKERDVEIIRGDSLRSALAEAVGIARRHCALSLFNGLDIAEDEQRLAELAKLGGVE